MSKFNAATVTIINWDKFNPRKDLKATNWLRLQNTLFEDPNFFDCEHSEILFWIYLLSIASKKQTGEFRFSISHAERVGRFSSKIIESSFSKLLELQCVRITLDPRYAHVTSTSRARHTTNERTNVTNETERDETNVTNEQVPGGTKSDATRNLTARIWEAYSDEYLTRYRVEPTRNQTVNSQIKSFASRLGEDAPEVSRFYVRHNKAFYVQAQHTVGPMLKDAEALHTQWQRGETMLSTKAREVERAQHNFDAFAQAAEILDRQEAERGN